MLECTNFRFIEDFVYADIYEDNNYIGVFGAEIYHVEHTTDLDNEMFNIFRDYYFRNVQNNKQSHLKLVK